VQDDTNRLIRIATWQGSTKPNRNSKGGKERPWSVFCIDEKPAPLAETTDEVKLMTEEEQSR